MAGSLHSQAHSRYIEAQPFNLKSMKTILLSLFLLAGVIANGQDWSTDVYKYGELYPGTVVTEDGETHEGFIKYRNRYAMQNDVIFFKKKDDKKSKVKYKTGDLKEYKVADKVYHVIHYSGGLTAKPLKANLLVKDGCISQYVWYDRHENHATMQKRPDETDEEFFARKYPSKVVFSKRNTQDAVSSDALAMKFAKRMSELVADNAELAAKVANKEKGYRMTKMYSIIDEYNDACTD